MIDGFEDLYEDVLTKAMGRLSVANSRRWISFLLEIIPRLETVNVAMLSEIEKRMLRMFAITIWARNCESWNDKRSWKTCSL